MKLDNTPHGSMLQTCSSWTPLSCQDIQLEVHSFILQTHLDVLPITRMVAGPPPLPPSLALLLCLPFTKFLFFLSLFFPSHNAHIGFMHLSCRDIKLENLFISSSGHLQLGDFGLAISTQEERAISPVGTLEYMPPEILRLPATDLVVKGLVNVDDIMPVDEKVDIWSFGVTVYELVTGERA